MKKIEKILLGRLDDINQSYINYQNNPFEPERAHNLRINIRELRGVLNFIKPLIDDDIYIEWNANLKASAQIYGLVRELDVLIDLCSQLALDNPEFSNHFKDLFNQLHKDRRKEMRRTFNVTNIRQIETTITALYEGIENTDWKYDNTDHQINWPKYVKKRLKKKAKKLEQKYEHTDLTDYTMIHTTRKDAKKVRYAARYLGSLTKLDEATIKKKAETIQDEFGEITDQHVNHQLLTDYANQVDEPELKALFEDLADLQPIETT